MEFIEACSWCITDMSEAPESVSAGLGQDTGDQDQKR
jgi:hypothetical protein